MRKRFKRYLRFKDCIIDSEQCQVKELAKQMCFIDKRQYCHYSSEIINDSDDLNDLWVVGDLVQYEDLNERIVAKEEITLTFNPFTNEKQVPQILWCKKNKDYKCLMIKNRMGVWEIL